MAGLGYALRVETTGHAQVLGVRWGGGREGVGREKFIFVPKLLEGWSCHLLDGED